MSKWMERTSHWLANKWLEIMKARQSLFCQAKIKRVQSFYFAYHAVHNTHRIMHIRETRTKKQRARRDFCPILLLSLFKRLIQLSWSFFFIWNQHDTLLNWYPRKKAIKPEKFSLLNFLTILSAYSLYHFRLWIRTFYQTYKIERYL